VFNQGEPIPDYALPRVTERFYSLPRPATGRKSTGLGLSFVREAAHLHDGAFQIRNVEDGVEARLTLPGR
jgi:two-component system sensor histidine kinase CreC